MSLVGIFFGSDTGNTEAVAKMIQKKLGKKNVEVKDIAKSTKEDIAEFDLILLGSIFNLIDFIASLLNGLVDLLKFSQSLLDICVQLHSIFCCMLQSLFEIGNLSGKLSLRCYNISKRGGYIYPEHFSSQL